MSIRLRVFTTRFASSCNVTSWRQLIYLFQLVLAVALLPWPAAFAQALKFSIAETGLTLGPLNGVAFGNGTFVASTGTPSSLRVFVSNDALTWREITLRVTPANSVNSPVRFVNGKFLLNDVTVSNNLVTANFRASTDGLTWTTTTAPSSPAQVAAEFAGDGTRIVAGGLSNFLVTSTNGGATWTNVPLLGGLGRWSSIVTGGGRWYLAGSFTVGFNTLARLYTSTDGFAYTESTAAPAPVSVAYGGGRWLVVGANGDIGYTSTDGTTFTATRSATGSTFDSTPNTVRYANGRFISLRSATSYLQSTDGVTWTSLGATFPAGLEVLGPVDLAYGNNTYVVTTAPSRSGSASLILVADASTVSTAGRLINLSVLSDLTTPDDSFTLGYVVGGVGASGAKPVVLRAAGPSLGALGVAGTLADPQLETFAGSDRTGRNDNWGGSPALAAALANVGAFAYTGPASLDAAIATSLTTRDNSVQISSANRGTGKVIAEIYDATPAASFTTTTPRLLNVSVRKHLGPGLTAGFVLGGPAPTKILIRAVGPGLAAFGVPDTVVDPQLTLFNDKSVKIAENNDWLGTVELTAAFASVGAFALPAATSKDAALVIQLAPGSYTVQVTGTANTTGVALVEIYEVP